MFTYKLIKTDCSYGIKRKLLGLIPFGYLDMEHNSFWWFKGDKHFKCCWSENEGKVKELYKRLIS